MKRKDEANFQPIRSTTQIWVVTSHQYGTSALVSQTSFRGETSGGVAKCRLFSQADKRGCSLNPAFYFAGYKNSQEVAYIKHAEKMKHQRQKALGEAPLEPTYEFNPRIKANMEMFHDDAQADQLNNNLGIPGQKAYMDPDFKPKRVKFNQEIFSAQMHRKVKKEQRKKRDELKNRPGATM